MDELRRYNVVLTGQIEPSRPPAEVNAELAALLKLQPARVARMLAEAPRTLKRAVPAEKAWRYFRLLTRAGAEIAIEPHRQHQQSRGSKAATPVAGRDVVTSTGVSVPSSADADAIMAAMLPDEARGGAATELAGGTVVTPEYPGLMATAAAESVNKFAEMLRDQSSAERCAADPADGALADGALEILPANEPAGIFTAQPPDDFLEIVTSDPANGALEILPADAPAGILTAQPPDDFLEIVTLDPANGALNILPADAPVALFPADEPLDILPADERMEFLPAEEPAEIFPTQPPDDPGAGSPAVPLGKPMAIDPTEWGDPTEFVVTGTPDSVGNLLAAQLSDTATVAVPAQPTYDQRPSSPVPVPAVARRRVRRNRATLGVALSVVAALGVAVGGGYHAWVRLAAPPPLAAMVPPANPQAAEPLVAIAAAPVPAGLQPPVDVEPALNPPTPLVSPTDPAAAATVAPFATPSAPFGLVAGITNRDLNARRRAADDYELPAVPAPHPFFSHYRARIGAEAGLCRLQATGAVTDTGDGAALRDAFAGLEAELSAVYGPAARSDVTLSHSTRQTPAQWMTALAQHERFLNSIWGPTTGAALPPALARVVLRASAASAVSGQITAEFTFANLAACVAERPLP